MAPACTVSSTHRCPAARGSFRALRRVGRPFLEGTERACLEDPTDVLVDCLADPPEEARLWGRRRIPGRERVELEGPREQAPSRGEVLRRPVVQVDPEGTVAEVPRSPVVIGDVER